jgi:hypothetical protein
MRSRTGKTPAISNAEARNLILDLFEEEALVIGGLAAFYDVEDDLIWRLVRSLDTIRARVLRRLDARGPAEADRLTAGQANLKPHPAIQDFLLKLRREAGVSP